MMNLSTITILLLIGNMVAVLRIVLIYWSLDLRYGPIQMLQKVFYDIGHDGSRDDIFRDALRVYITVSAVVLPIAGLIFLFSWGLLGHLVNNGEPLGRRQIMFMTMLSTNFVWMVVLLVLYNAHGRPQLES